MNLGDEKMTDDALKIKLQVTKCCTLLVYERMLFGFKSVLLSSEYLMFRLDLLF
jgi:hypothetical protein